MHLDTLILESLIAVSDTGSFTLAARKVGRTQSAISQQIAKLEDRLGVSLFVRGKHLTPTAEGEIVLGYARQMGRIHHELIDRFQEPQLVGEIKLGLPEDFASAFLYDVLVEFSRLHPRIHLNIECDLTLNLYERFKHKEFDLVLVKMSRPEDFPNGINVRSEPLEWVGGLEPTPLSDPISLVLSPQPCVYRAHAIRALEKIGKHWRIVFSSPSYAGKIAAVKAGMGITVLPRNIIPKTLRTLHDIPQLPQLDNTHISLLKHDQNNPAINSFEDYVLEKLNS